MALQKILHVVTLGSSLRSKVGSWSAEDGDLINYDKEIELSRALNTPYYPTPMHAIADGWRLLAPPTKVEGQSNNHEWWFEK